MHKHAIVGSRKWPNPGLVTARVLMLHAQRGPYILVSGGADGVCATAEAEGVRIGIPVISFRIGMRTPSTAPTEYVVEEWRLHRGSGDLIVHEPGWANFESAATYKAMLIAERAETADAFWDGSSRGTSAEIEFFATEGVKCEVHRP